MENTNVIEGTVIPTSQLNLAAVLRIPAIRQVTLLIGVAAAVAAGFAIVLWSRTPALTPVYPGLDGAEAAEAAEALQGTDIEFKLDSKTGVLLVPAARRNDARLELAAQGLSLGSNAGMSMLDEQSSFGVSQFMESARYQHALEAELAHTIAAVGVVREARVHLALPKQTTFIRDQQNASASVLLNLGGSQVLEADKASAIVHLVASSVPNLSAENVTLIDQRGNLLSSGDEQAIEAQATTQFRYARRLEETYKSRIEEILTPLVGMGRVRAQVDADIDFTVAEEARETFNPANSVVRSEHIDEQSGPGNSTVAAGIPGALSNQPPEASGAAADVDAASAAEQVATMSKSRTSTRNFEVDRTISRTKPQAGRINKLSVAVLVDDGPIDGDSTPTALTENDIARYTSLVREAVGFNEARGDTVVVVNAAFRNVEPFEAAEPPAFWEKPLLIDAMKQILGVGLALALAFGVVRPMLRGVLASHAPGSGEFGGKSPQYAAVAGGTQFGGSAAAIPPPKYEEKVAAAKNITGHDPARVAQVVKKWVS
ncbi:MAG: flagellar basal-body MS-ring/collar protein FliF, partial [Gammaproteobacteria bacterium]|nr:flagellar basal-body MS-ring/collar protein FliF [Gammaproteobacteria bacterium]